MDAQLFYEDYLSALRDDVQALGGNKVVGKIFYGTLAPDEAGRRLATKLNENRQERLSTDEERWIMKRAREVRGFSAALYFVCDEAGFERPKAINREEEKTQVLREVLESMAALQKRFDELLADHKLPAPLRRVL